MQFGGAMYLLTHVIMDNPDPKANLNILWPIMQEFYKKFSVQERFTYFNRLTMFCRKSGPPKLRGKAGEVKSFGPLMLHLWEMFYNPHVELQRMVRVMLLKHCQMEALMNEHKHCDFFSALASA